MIAFRLTPAYIQLLPHLTPINAYTLLQRPAYHWSCTLPFLSQMICA